MDLELPVFSPDGRALYGVKNVPRLDVPERRGLWKVEFDPERTTMVPGTEDVVVRGFGVSAHQNKVVMAGMHGQNCGLFEVELPEGRLRCIRSDNCRGIPDWIVLSVSPAGDYALGTVGSLLTHDLHMERLELATGRVSSLGSDYRSAMFSPDGKWIAAVRGRRLFLLNAIDFRRVRDLGNTAQITPAWSPDGRYLLLHKYYLFHCGFYLDVEPPASLEILDIANGKRSVIKSSDCALTWGTTGWLSRK